MAGAGLKKAAKLYGAPIQNRPVAQSRFEKIATPTVTEVRTGNKNVLSAKRGALLRTDL